MLCIDKYTHLYMQVPVLVAVVCASCRYGAELLAIATEGLRGELVLQTHVGRQS